MKIEILKNTALGMFAGVVISTAFYLALDNNYSSELKENLAHGLTIVVTLFAAGLALAGVLATIQAQAKQEEDRRTKSLQAAKATLPLALSQLISISRRGIEICLDINCQDSTTTELLEQVRLGDLVLQSLKETIEYSDEVSAQRLASIVAMYQVLDARLGSFLTEEYPTDFQRAHAAVKWATLYSKIEDAFDFARNEADHISPKLTRQSTYGIFHVLLMINLWDHPELEKEINRVAELDDPEVI
ncbi:hypothetical protein K3X41_11280 [Aliiroseovarius crassostreae]|uniref:hypothetical protein n=1 Tax=Aliiroseovarius crassostreae TaxID=154981 RepID=UPI00220B8EEE|nr:hypothetical protein [Aliiroseovarius crassostreae]UWQ10478.1 hypothetical protein K3X41_11280 [Aliiroseovarius crassostreae]